MPDASPALSWGHININVSDLDASIAFYRKLGFDTLLPGIPYLNVEANAAHRPLPESACTALGMPAGSAGRGCIMQLGNGFPKLDLTEWQATSQRQPHNNADLGLVRFCLASQDLARDYESLLDAGVVFLSAPRPTQDDKADIAICVDPDGTLIELIQVHLERW